jgi:myosin heavy subunit
MSSKLDSTDNAFEHETSMEIEDMSRKLKLLDGERKASYETRTKAMKQNQDTLDSVKKQNKELKAQLAKLLREQSSSNKSYQERQYEHMETQVHQLRKQYDESCHEFKALAKKAAGKRDKLQDLESERAPILTDDSPMTIQIRILENRLDKAMIKYNEAQSIRKTYEHILRRLKEERIGFDNQLQAIERTLKAKEHDYQDLLNMNHDANYLREIAKAELAQAKSEFDEKEKEQEKNLKEKRQYVGARIEMTSKLSKREAQKREQETNSSNNRLLANSSMTFNSAQNDTKLEMENEKLANLEGQWRKIKEVTGVNDANDVIQKFLSSHDTHRNLVSMTKEAQRKIDDLMLKRQHLKAKLDENKYSQNSALGSKRIIDDYMQQLNDLQSASERNRVKYERVKKILINVKAGVEHLSERLKADKADESLGEKEYICNTLEECKDKMHELQLDQKPKDLSVSIEALNVDSNHIRLSQNNVRITLEESDEEDNGDEEKGDEESEDEGEGDVMDRERVKRYSKFAADKGRKRSKKKKA